MDTVECLVIYAKAQLGHSMCSLSVQMKPLSFGEGTYSADGLVFKLFLSPWSAFVGRGSYSILGSNSVIYIIQWEGLFQERLAKLFPIFGHIAFDINELVKCFYDAKITKNIISVSKDAIFQCPVEELLRSPKISIL